MSAPNGEGNAAPANGNGPTAAETVVSEPKIVPVNGENGSADASVSNKAKKGISFSLKKSGTMKKDGSMKKDQSADGSEKKRRAVGLQKMGKSFKEAFARSSQAQNAKAAKPIPIEYDIEMAGFGLIGIGTALGYHKIGPDYVFAGVIALGGVLLFLSRVVKLSKEHKAWKAKQSADGDKETEPSPIKPLVLIGASLVLILIVASDILLLFQLKYPYVPEAEPVDEDVR